MAKRRRKFEQTYTYECSITEKSYKLTRKAEKQEDLVSVDAYYELNPEEDDRPDVIKAKLGVGEHSES